MLSTPNTRPAGHAADTILLAHWLRLLWGTAPALHLGSQAPFISAGAIHLPAQPHWQLHCAAAAHAAAHLVYSPARFDGTALVPITRHLLALLEDARVEALAMRELPGLARLWRPLHTASPSDGVGCEALMGRLARALADPNYADPHPWVQKGRRLFYLDDGLGDGRDGCADQGADGAVRAFGVERLALLALRTPAELRDAALRLGHDLGQLRLPFNARGHRPAPAYRDDHRWMWDAEQLRAVQPPPVAQPLPRATPPPPSDPPADPPPALDDAPRHSGTSALRYPEWDHVIRRLRPAWCQVLEVAALPHTGPALPLAISPTAAHILRRRLLQPLRALAKPQASLQRSASGDVVDLDALVRWRVDRRQAAVGCVVETRSAMDDPRLFHQQPRRSLAQAAVWLLVDRSASSAQPLHPTGHSLLQGAVLSATALAGALRDLGVSCAVAAFNSNGRHAVQLDVLQTPDAHRSARASPDDALPQHLQALRSAGSTRLGAALRHVTGRLLAQRASTRWLLLLSDGQPHDVDAHDQRYLVEDARHAVRQARRAAVRMVCIRLAPSLAGASAAQPANDAVATRIFGPGGVQTAASVDALPQMVLRLLG